MRRTHSTTPAPSNRLDHQRIAKFPGRSHCVFLGLDDSVTTRCDRHPRFARSGTGSVLVAHRLHRASRRPDKFDVAAFADFHEVRVLGEKSVAWMDRIYIADFG